MRRAARHRRVLVDSDGARFGVAEARTAARLGVIVALPLAVLAFAGLTLWPDADPVTGVTYAVCIPVMVLISTRRDRGWDLWRDVLVTLAATGAAAGAAAAGFHLAGVTAASGVRWAAALAVLVAVPVSSVVADWRNAGYERRRNEATVG